MLDLDSEIDSKERSIALKEIIIEKIVKQFQVINTESDLRNYVLKLPTLSIIPLVVKRHFNLE